MKKVNLILIASLILISGCGQQSSDAELADTAATDTSQAIANNTRAATTTACKAGEQLLYEEGSFSSYTEDKIRGTGVVSISLKVNDRLDIYNEDDSVFGFLVLNEDLSFYTIDMPRRLVARKVVPEYDFMAFDFDADEDKSDGEFVYVYANKQRKKIRKAGLNYQYQSWSDHIKMQPVSLKPCNKLTNAPSLDPEILFNVTAINGDEIKIRSSKDCGGEDSPYVKAEGTVKWRKGDELLVNLETCN